MLTIKNAKLAIATLGFTGFLWLGGGQAIGAPAAGGGGASPGVGGGAAHSSGGGGGGGAVNSGGGGHASAAAPTAQHSEPAASGGHHLSPPAAEQSAKGQARGTPIGHGGERSHPLPANPVRRDNPYHDRLRANQTNGVYYNYPYFPLSYGYTNGWYGDNSGSNYSPYYTPFDTSNYNNNNGQTSNPAPSQQASPDTTYSAQQPPASASGSSPEIQAQITNAVDKSPAMTSANNAVALSQSTFDHERERVLAALRSQPAYQQALQRRHDAASEVRNAQATSGAASNAVVAAASEKLDAGDDVTKMEEQAVATDPAASAAKARLDQAVADRNALRAELTAHYQSGAKQ
jgi:hypothetical protein